jgi:hypothetical protein
MYEGNLTSVNNYKYRRSLVNVEYHHIDFLLKLVDITVFLDMKESVKTVQEM